MSFYFYQRFREANFSGLETLATKWQSVYDAIKDLDDDIRDEVLRPLKDNGYWEGQAAPYAWAQIDDIQRQVTAAAKVAQAVKKTIEDGAGELKAVQTKFDDAVRRFGEQNLSVQSDGKVTAWTMLHTNPSKDENRKAAEAQRELNDLIREAFQVDQNLSFTLMENIGLDWFNTKHLRTDINGTSTISTDRFDALDRAMRGKDPYPDKNNETPREVVLDWLAGTGSENREWSQGDKFIEQLRESESMKTIRDQVVTGWYKGSPQGVARHKIDGKSLIEQAGIYAKDMAGLFAIDNLWTGKPTRRSPCWGPMWCITRSRARTLMARSSCNTH